MKDHATPLDAVRRPGLLVRAARHAMHDYVRHRDLERIVPTADPETAEGILMALIAVEEGLERTRRSGCISYSVSRHIEVMSALMAEARAAGQAAAPSA